MKKNDARYWAEIIGEEIVMQSGAFAEPNNTYFNREAAQESDSSQTDSDSVEEYRRPVSHDDQDESELPPIQASPEPESELSEEDREQLEHEKMILAQEPMIDRNTYAQVVIGPEQIRLLKDLYTFMGPAQLSREIGVCEPTVLRVLAGFMERCSPKVQRKVRRFFYEGASGG